MPGKSAGRLAGLGFFKQRGVGVVEVFQLHARDFLADETFDGENVRGILGDHDGKGVAARLGAARAPDAVDVILRMLRHVVIDDVADVGDVKSARGDVRGDEHLEFAFAKTGQRLFAFLLRAVGMQDGHGMVRALERAGDAVGPVFGAAEDDHGFVVHAVEQFEQEVGFLCVGNGIDDMLHRLGGRAAGTDLDRLRIVHRPLDEGFDLRRNGGRKQRGVAFARAFFHQPADVRQKAHVKHPVGFVEDEKFHLVELQRALLQMVEQAAGCGDYDVRAGLEFVVLLAVAHAADKRR